MQASIDFHCLRSLVSLLNSKLSIQVVDFSWLFRELKQKSSANAHSRKSLCDLEAAIRAWFILGSILDWTSEGGQRSSGQTALVCSFGREPTGEPSRHVSVIATISNGLAYSSP